MCNVRLALRKTVGLQFTSTVIKVWGGMKHRNANPAMCRPFPVSRLHQQSCEGIQVCEKFSLNKGGNRVPKLCRKKRSMVFQRRGKVRGQQSSCLLQVCHRQQGNRFSATESGMCDVSGEMSIFVAFLIKPVMVSFSSKTQNEVKFIQSICILTVVFW